MQSLSWLLNANIMCCDHSIVISLCSKAYTARKHSLSNGIIHFLHILSPLLSELQSLTVWTCIYHLEILVSFTSLCSFICRNSGEDRQICLWSDNYRRERVNVVLWQKVVEVSELCVLFVWSSKEQGVNTHII